jgi:TfoX/Sxy family transcriptional regulator of competence genes
LNYDEKSAERIRRVLGESRDVAEKKMMGGLVFMVDEHMCCGLNAHGLMIRVGTDARDAMLKLTHVKPMLVGDRSPAGFVRIDPAGYASDVDLRSWIQRGLDFVATLPPKKLKTKSSARKAPR